MNKQSPQLKRKRGFTLLEMIISIGIFVAISALLMSKYSGFNQSVLLTDLAYDMALSVRTAQTYGLSVRSNGTGATSFTSGYGVRFSTLSSTDSVTAQPYNKEIILFADTYNTNGRAYKYDRNSNPSLADTDVTYYNIKRGAIISDVCASNGTMCTSGSSQGSNQWLDIGFLRPDPTAVITWCTNNGANCDPYTSAKVTIQAPDGSTRSIQIYSNGLITVSQ